MLFDKNTFNKEDLVDLKPKLKQGNYQLTINSFSFIPNEKGGYFSIKGITQDGIQWNDGVINGKNKKGFNFLLRNLHVQVDPEGDWTIPTWKPGMKNDEVAEAQAEWLAMVQGKVVGATIKVSVERGAYTNKFYYENGFESNDETDETSETDEPVV